MFFALSVSSGDIVTGVVLCSVFIACECFVVSMFVISSPQYRCLLSRLVETLRGRLFQVILHTLARV
jgi:hypothetical protein